MCAARAAEGERRTAAPDPVPRADRGAAYVGLAQGAGAGSWLLVAGGLRRSPGKTAGKVLVASGKLQPPIALWGAALTAMAAHPAQSLNR